MTMEKVDMNVQDILNIAVELEQAKAQVVGAKADAIMYKKLYEEEQKKTNDTKKVELRITKESQRWDYGTDSYVKVANKIDTITTDLNDAIARIKEELKKATEEDVNLKDDKIKDLTKKYKELRESLDDQVQDAKKAYDKWYDKWRKEVEEKHSKKVETLTKDLEKERENKTDKELEKKRLEEIATLKNRIKNLEEEMNDLTKLTWWERTWFWKGILSIQAKVKAYRIASENEVRADKVLDSYPPSFGSTSVGSSYWYCG